MDPEVLRLRAERYVKTKQAKDEELAKIEQAKAEELARIQAFETNFSNIESDVQGIHNAGSLERIRDLTSKLFNFLLSHHNVIRSKYHERTAALITDIVQAISSNPRAKYNVFDDSSNHAIAIKTLMDEVTDAFDMDPIDIEWMDTEQDRALAEKLDREINRVDSRWMSGLSEIEIRRILGDE